MKIILNILTHGDERMGLRVAEKILKMNIKNNAVDVQIANSKSFVLGKRFLDQDLNRSFPGRKKGNYEEMLAWKLSSDIKKADIVLDIHSTKSSLKNALIATKLNNKTLEYIEAIGPDYVLVMNTTKNNALISQAKVGIAFEYGKDNSPEALAKTVVDIKRLLSYLGLIGAKFRKRKKRVKYFDVFSEVKRPKGYHLLKKTRNCKLIRKGEKFATNGKNFITAKESFYPILFGEKSYKKIFGFKAKKIS